MQTTILHCPLREYWQHATVTNCVPHLTLQLSLGISVPPRLQHSHQGLVQE